MITIAVSLLFGLAAFLALMVVGLCLHSGLALGMALLARPDLTGQPTPARRNGGARQTPAAIFPKARDHATAGLRGHSPRAAA